MSCCPGPAVRGAGYAVLAPVGHLGIATVKRTSSFGITIARPGHLNPYYTYGAILLAAPGWAVGTALGIMAGNALPLRVVSALSVALYGMFLAIIIPPAAAARTTSLPGWWR